MMSLKWGYLHTHVIEKVERDKMSAYRDDYSDEEEERMVARVGGRARGLMQVMRRVQREREGAGWTLLNSQEAQDVQLRMQRKEVGLPHGQVEALVRRLEGLQAWETMIEQNSQQTRPKEPQCLGDRAWARPNTPSYT